MSEAFSVKSVFRTYTVSFVDSFLSHLQVTMRDGDTIVLDANVRRMHSKAFDLLLASRPHILIEATEEQKSYQNLGPIIGSLIEKGFKRNNRLIAIGGGITQDVAAFISSILYRGIEWLFFPSTLLAQCDSCIGSKTSINFGKHKNQIGSFYPPSGVAIDLSFLDSLPDFAIRSGIGEMVHYFLVEGEEEFRRFRSLCVDKTINRAVLETLIERSLQIKKKYVERDEFDRGERQVFNYGHSFGHALESITDFAIPHGVAVCFGMDIANFLSMKLGLIPAEVREEIRQVLAWNWRGYNVDGMDVRAFERALSKDKKNVGKELRVILTNGFGKMFKSPLTLDGEVSRWLDDWFRDWRKS